MRKSVVWIVGVAVALMLTACGSVGAVASSIITSCPATYYQDVMWSPDNSHLAFTASKGHNGWDLYVMNPDGTNTQHVASNPLGIVELQWLPDSQTLAYTDRAKVFTVELGGTVSELNLPAAGIWDVAFSPDGNTVAYSRFMIEPHGVLKQVGVDISNADGSATTQLLSGEDVLPQWSPDGTHIAFMHPDGQELFVSTIHADGSDELQLTTGSGPMYWSPDGQWISFVEFVSDGLYIIRPDGTDKKLVTMEMADFNYSWLPDGQHIAFETRPNHIVSVIDVNTFELERIPALTFDQSLPVWSPDGQRIAYIGHDSANSNSTLQDIYVVNRDGTGLTRLTDNPARYQCFNWPF